ncbi:hypothetical protein BSLG_000912 [Batrachochytrium salamandrivorans]|nr:hypothetical protein BSLG_000912 [Batrachochytrium salamandrivorans]
MDPNSRSASSEELFSCSAVYKKKSGRMAVSSTYFHWSESAMAAPAISIPYPAVKAQLVNAIGASGKVLLKLSLWPVGDTPEITHNFAFSGGATAEADRDRIKDIIATRIAANRQMAGLASASTASAAVHPISDATPRSVSAVSTPTSASHKTALTVQDIQARQTLLSRNKDLAKIHKEIVMGGLISEQDFWSTRRQTIVNQEWQTFQKKGPSSGSLADIKPTVDGDGSDVKYTLTPDIIHSIFTEYPGVHKAFQDHVPDKMTEKEFWGKYLASKYFHRNRITIAKETGDIFDDYMQEDANDLLLTPMGIQFSARNQLIDLSTTAEDHIETGNRPDLTMRAGSVKTSLPLIRKFNRHSALILKSSINPNDPLRQKTAAQSDLLFQDETVLDDLEPVKVSKLTPLQIQDPTMYFDSLAQDSITQSCHSGTSRELSYSACRSDTALRTLTELYRKRQLCQSHMPVSQVKRLKQYQDAIDVQSSVNELLRHFWSNLSKLLLGDIGVRDKMLRIVAALKKNMIQLNAIERQAHTSGEDTSISLVKTARLGVEAALKAMPQN